ncbi:peptide chain release factor N(5)-glutamine methyltransferase [Nioella nitratireducens]|uniref:peptide chain release factor N(5)-glutamine methyltransferase n=1 Tax=Nioella nitratireducens TaxID=1287720 RepID=UPI000A5C2347|nr:peptide chain release factor N(5)-glutamine methyltransferase [Nioella nitratireducens]
MIPTGSEALRRGIVSLRAAGVETPELDARLLMAEALGVPRARLTVALHDPLGDIAEADFFHMIALRESRRPVSQILGRRLFFDRWFAVTPEVLDPRPETETLVATALDHPFDRVLDLGTGSGAIVVTLLAERPQATGVGTDLSPHAVQVARRNALSLGVEGRLSLTLSNWYASIAGRFDLIVSNPPYIAATEMAALSPEVREHEPRMALTDEADGLTAYRAIAVGALAHLRPGGWLMVEIGPTQGAAVSDIFRQAGLTEIGLRPDFDGRDRVVLARAPLEIPADSPDLGQGDA